MERGSVLCKVGDSELETDDLSWQQLGSGMVNGPTTHRAQPKIAALDTTAATPARNAIGNDHLDLAGLRQRLTEMESRHSSDSEKVRKGAFDQGVQQGRQDATTQMQDALDRLARTIQEVAQVKCKVRADAEHELVKLSLAISRRILHREVTADPQSLRGVVYAALQRLQNREITKIRVFPPSIPAIRAALERNGGMAAIEIVGDGMLQPGALLIETSLGELDASVETQLQEIERGFADRLQLR